jgi:hypothetical protein
VAITQRTAAVAQGPDATQTSITAPTVSGVADGDLVLLVFGFSNGVDPGNPSGWLTPPGLATTQLPTGTGVWIMPLYQIVSGGSVSWPTLSGLTAGRVSCIAQAFVGVDGTTPWDVNGVMSTSTTASASFGETGITPVTDNSMLISSYVGNWSTGTFTSPPSGMTIQANHTSGQGRSNALADKILTPAGASGTQTWVASASGVSVAGFVAALRPAITIQQVRPDADNAAGGWTTTPLWSKVDEASAGGDVITATSA